jgi:perosamine synthetase
MKQIPVAGPWITQLEVDLVRDAVQNSWYDKANYYYDLFEHKFAQYLGVKHTISLPHCTSAIHLSLLALGVGPGDEVIVPDVTWIASAAPISYVGAQPVFADIDPDTWCIDVKSLEECITVRTKAIILVDLYGGMPDMDAVLLIADHYGIPVVEDAAEAIGAEYKGKKAGSFGRTGVFSFHGSKTLTTGEGGLLATNDSELFNRVLFLRDHGRPPGDVFFTNEEVAYKYKMSALQAALGYAQLQRIDDLVDKKRQIFLWYKERLGQISGLRLNYEPEGTKNSYWMTSIVLNDNIDLSKFELMKILYRKGINTRPFFSPLSSLKAYEKYVDADRARKRNQISYSISKQAINLPSALILEEKQVDYVCSKFLQVFNNITFDKL